MGKARIVSHLGDGLYSIEVLHARERIDAEIARLTDLIAELDDQLAALETEKAEAVAVRDLAQLDLNEAVREYAIERDAAIAAGEPIPPPPDFTPLIVAVQQAAQQVQIIDARIATIKARRLALVKRRQMLEAIPADQTQQAWCADYTEDLAGEVGTVELPGEGTVGEFAEWRRMIVRPGHEGAAAYSAARDGQLFHRAGMSPEQAYFNAAILPGWQRWLPLHRIGTITAIDFEANTCSITLQAEDSSAQRLAIDPPDLQFNLTDVPIVYMDCNAVAFEEGDRVLIEFQNRDWKQPRVIGFEKEPKQCLPDYIVMASQNYISEDNIPIPVYNLDETEIIEERSNLFGAVVFRTTNQAGALDNITWSMPDEYTGDYDPTNFQGLFVRWSSVRLNWTVADFYFGDTVGENRKELDLERPDEMTTDHIVLIAADATDLTLIQEGGTTWLRSIDINTLQLPRLNYAFPIYEPIENGEAQLYRYTVDTEVFGTLNADKRSTGTYTLEVIPEADIPDVLLGDGETPGESSEEIPETLTIRGVTYERKKVGTIKLEADDRFRQIAVVWGREDRPDPQYTEDFWALP